MSKSRPPMGWERAKNCFPVPNELLQLGLPAGAVAVYVYLLCHADRRTNQCHPSEATMAKVLHLSRNTVAKHVRLLEEYGLIITERTQVQMKMAFEKTETCGIPSSLYTMSWSSVTSDKWPSWSVSKCSRSWRHRSQKPRVRPREPLCGLLRGRAASLPRRGLSSRFRADFRGHPRLCGGRK